MGCSVGAREVGRKITERGRGSPRREMGVGEFLRLGYAGRLRVLETRRVISGLRPRAAG